jgi:copper(I)-binding protein
VKRANAAVLAACVVTACGRDHPPLATGGEIVVRKAYATASAAPEVSALYLTIENRGTGADTLLSVATPAGHAMLHTVEVRNGLSNMRPVDRLPIDGGAQVRMRPGAYHIMLTELPAPLSAGDTIDVETVFARAGTLRFQAPVLTYTDVVEQLERDPPGHR